MIKVFRATEKRVRDRRRQRLYLQIGCFGFHLTRKEGKALIKKLKGGNR